jgi:hypothetical protein
VQAAIGALVPGPAGAATQGTSPGALWAQEGDVEGEPPPYGSREDARRAIATMLQEGARIQEIDRNDAPAARRLLELAIQLAPRQRSLQQAHRRLLAASQTQPRMPPPPAEVPVVDERTRPVSVGRSPFSASPSAVPPARDSAPEAEPLPREPSVPTARGGSTDRDGGLLLAPDTTQAPWLPGEGDTAYPDDDAIEDEIRVEELTGKLRANPADEACAWELIDVLDRLGRDHDMLALLSARIDEGSNDREAMAERRRALLERMVGDAEAAGRHDEAALYRLMLERND